MQRWKDISWVFFLCLTSYPVKGYLQRTFTQVSLLPVCEWENLPWVRKFTFWVWIVSTYQGFIFSDCFPMCLYDALGGLVLSLGCQAWLIMFPVAGYFAGSCSYVLEDDTNHIWRHWCAFSSKNLALGGFI
jgi:hypothetical protein